MFAIIFSALASNLILFAVFLIFLQLLIFLFVYFILDWRS